MLDRRTGRKFWISKEQVRLFVNYNLNNDRSKTEIVMPLSPAFFSEDQTKTLGSRKIDQSTIEEEKKENIPGAADNKITHQDICLINKKMKLILNNSK